MEVHSGKVSKEPTKVPIRERQRLDNTMKTLHFPTHTQSALPLHLSTTNRRKSRVRTVHEQTMGALSLLLAGKSLNKGLHWRDTRSV